MNCINPVYLKYSPVHQEDWEPAVYESSQVFFLPFREFFIATVTLGLLYRDLGLVVLNFETLICDNVNCQTLYKNNIEFVVYGAATWDQYNITKEYMHILVLARYSCFS